MITNDTTRTTITYRSAGMLPAGRNAISKRISRARDFNNDARINVIICGLQSLMSGDEALQAAIIPDMTRELKTNDASAYASIVDRYLTLLCFIKVIDDATAQAVYNRLINNL